jgi:hypothetical protein
LISEIYIEDSPEMLNAGFSVFLDDYEPPAHGIPVISCMYECIGTTSDGDLKWKYVNIKHNKNFRG